MTRYRVIETTEGIFVPQFKQGWLSRWHGFEPNADTMSQPALVIWVQQDDPTKAARFATAQDAHDFIARVKANNDRGWREEEAKQKRISDGFNVKRVAGR